MYFFQARDLTRQNITGEFMDERTECGVFLRGPAHHCKRPYRIFAMPYFMHTHHREIMLERVITEMIPERSFRFIFPGPHFSRNDEIRIGRNTISIVVSVTEFPSA